MSLIKHLKDRKVPVLPKSAMKILRFAPSLSKTDSTFLGKFS